MCTASLLSFCTQSRHTNSEICAIHGSMLVTTAGYTHLRIDVNASLRIDGSKGSHSHLCFGVTNVGRGAQDVAGQIGQLQSPMTQTQSFYRTTTQSLQSIASKARLHLHAGVICDVNAATSRTIPDPNHGKVLRELVA